MKIVRLTISNFRGIKQAEFHFDSHTLLVGQNNVGKSTICEALDLVLGPDRASRFPPVEEFDFHNAQYSVAAEMEGEPPTTPKNDAGRLAGMAIVVDLFKDIERSRGSSQVEKLQKWADKLRDGNMPRAAFIANLLALIEGLSIAKFSGNPVKDWLAVKALLREAEDSNIGKVATNLDYLVGFNRGKRIGAALGMLWERQGQYLGAREAFESAIAQDQLAGRLDAPNGIQIMTVHKAKGKQFDGVLIVRAGRFEGTGQVSTFIWREDTHPFHRSRKILRVAITRAKTHTMILDPRFPACPILAPYNL